MLKLFFNRDAILVKIAEAIGLALAIPATVIGLSRHEGVFATALFVIFWVMYVFIRACAMIRWYKDAPRETGIELHLKKALIPTSYIMFISGFFLLLVNPVPVLLSSILIFCIIAHVNVILIYLHLHDKDRTPPNFYTSRRFMQNDDAI